jgi:hypothetical protein
MVNVKVKCSVAVCFCMFGTQVMVKEMSNVVLLRCQEKKRCRRAAADEISLPNSNFRNFYSPSYVHDLMTQSVRPPPAVLNITESLHVLVGM